MQEAETANPADEFLTMIEGHMVKNDKYNFLREAAKDPYRPYFLKCKYDAVQKVLEEPIIKEDKKTNDNEG